MKIIKRYNHTYHSPNAELSKIILLHQYMPASFYYPCNSFYFYYKFL